jgi:RimJ/RimL family protein N-acetyltransferase
MIFASPIRLKYIKTDRLMIRPARVTDAKLMHDAMKDSFKVLKRWMPWAQSLASLRDTIIYLEEGEQLWQSIPRESVEQPLQIVDLEDQQYIGASGIKPANLLVPSFEVGYWVNQKFTGNGLISEAMNALTRYLFEVQTAKRVEINC